MTSARRIDVIGVPFNSAGLTDGVARAPAALRGAGLVDAIRRVGIDVDAATFHLRSHLALEALSSECGSRT